MNILAKRKARDKGEGTRDKVKISACYMVKDAAQDLRRSLESVAKFVDEIIVVDTGSTDSTVEVAEEFGARIFHEPWQDDFSTPRNVAINAAKGNWILFLDADEFFVNDTAKNLHAAIEPAHRKNIKGIYVKRVEVDADNGNALIGTTHVLRIFANVPRIHYVGKIHEQVLIGNEDLTPLVMAPDDMLTLWHTGYSASIVKAKHERNLQPLLEELETSDKPERTYMYLAECYCGLGDEVNAEKFARLDMAIKDNPSSRSIRILIRILEKNSARFDEYFDTVKLAVERYPEVPEFSFKLAKGLALRGDYREADDEMERAIAKFKSYGEQYETTNFDDSDEKLARQLIETWRRTISACYIVKNSAKDLRRSLKSITKFVDEIIIVDTGSTDSTVAVAEEFGAKIFHEPWQDDFSTPRNVALRAAKCRWILFLDADEFFVNDTAKNLREVINRAKTHGAQGVLVSRAEIDADNGNKNLGINHVLRLFENVKGVHYVGKIHEQVFIGDELLTSLMTVPAKLLTIWHTGYSASIHKVKMERNLKSLLEELAATKTPKRIYGYLAETYHALNDDANAEKFARLDFDSGETLSDNSTRILLEVLSKNPAQIDDLLKYLRLAIERYPEVPEFSAKLAEVLAQRGDYRAAVKEMESALDKAAVYGEGFESSTFDEEAAQYARQLINEWREKFSLTPEEKLSEVTALTDELIHAVEVLHDKGKILRTAERLFTLKPDEPAPIEKVASVYVDYKIEDEAETVITWLEENFPPSAYRLMLRARLHFLRKNCLDAIKVAERALNFDGDFVTMMLIHNLLGQTYRFIGKPQKAVAHYKRNALIDLTELKDSPQLAQTEKIRREEYSNYLFNLHYLNVPREEIFKETRGFNKFFAKIPRYNHDRDKHSCHEKIRVGYISPDVRFHVVAFFSTHLFTNYDKTRFEVFIYANNTADGVTEQFAAIVDGFREILGKSAEEVAAQIVADEIDILVDLAGHTANNSLPVMAYKPAPIQISGIGYFDSTGLDTIDYFLADKFTDPEGLNENFFTEKILRLQHSHFCYVWHDLQFMPTPAPCTENGFVTFASFNDFAKTNDTVIAAWAKILNAVPKSRLYLKSRAFHENCGLELAKKRMTAAGIDVERVGFENFNPVYVQCYERVDIALDTFPYPGGGTTCDALYMGVPVITLVGERHNSRFGYSLLMNMGLEELCAFSEAEYVQKAIELANDRERLSEYHLTIRRKLEESPVMNDAIYMGELERAYEKIFNAWLAEEPLPDFPQEPEPVTNELAEEYYRRALSYVPLEGKNGESKFNRVDFKRTLYFAELAAQVRRDAKLLLTTAARRYMLNDNVGAYETMREAVEHFSAEDSNFFKSECYSKLAQYAQDNRQHIEAVKNFERAFELAETEKQQLEAYDSILLALHFLDISGAEMAAAHFDCQKFFEDVEPFTTYHKRHDRIKIGYISGDFRKHAAFAVMFGFITCHDRKKFEVTCYSRNPADDEFTELYRRGVEHFVDVQNLTAAELAKKIHDDEIDIAVDLASHTGYNGLPALAYRPAPLQISGVYMSTTGLKQIDYFITDKILDPLGNEEFFSEKLLYMPAQFSYARREDLPASTGAPCVKNGFVTFGTICRYSKITDDMLAVWIEILRRVPDSKLLLRAQEFISNRTQDELYRVMKELGADMERVIIRPAVSDYFGAISQIDIMLDGYPYVGGATTLDALYMGVPVVNLYGERHSTRFGKSILHSVGLDELAVDNVNAYIQTAVALANDFDTLDALHKGLRQMFLNSDALDPVKYCRRLEAKFEQLLD